MNHFRTENWLTVVASHGNPALSLRLRVSIEKKQHVRDSWTMFNFTIRKSIFGLLLDCFYVIKPAIGHTRELTRNQILVGPRGNTFILQLLPCFILQLPSKSLVLVP